METVGNEQEHELFGDGRLRVERIGDDRLVFGVGRRHIHVEGDRSDGSAGRSD